MKDNKFFKIITSKYVILGSQLIISIVAVYFCFKLKLIPMKYIIGIIIALLILLVSFFGIIYSGEKRSENGATSKRSIITKIISLLLSIALVLGCTMLIRSDNFIDKVSDAVGQKYVISVIALKDSDINKKSLDGKKFGVCYEKDSKTLTTALADMEDEIGQQEYTKYDTYIQLADALYNKEVDCIVVGEQFRSQLQVNHENFDNETKIITSYSYDAKLEVTTKKTDVTEKPFSVYVTGIDVYGSLNTVSRSDVNLIVTVNPKTKQILMTSIPRDCEINLHSNGELDKLTHTGNYGTAETINTIQDLLDMEINYFVRTNFSGMTNIVDALGGITVESDEEFDTLHGNYHIVKGLNEMDGDMALCFVRERKRLKAGDFARGRNQQKVLSALIDKALSPKIITNFDRILTALEGTFETDMTSDEIRSLLNMQLDDMADWNIINVQIEGEYYDCYETYSMYGTKSDVMKPFNSHIKRVRKLINKVEEGKKITDSELEGLAH
ncbi:LCP family protein [Thomasclavelia spiroformis]|uniref:LCP family protein n=1 Tax=Thomasclavelia spiroformis TaxID=29348 RepID=UPI003995E8B9